MSDERDFKRGDIVRTVGDITGMVMGWIDDTYLCLLDLEDLKSIVAGYKEEISLLVKVEDLQTLDFLPKEIRVQDTKPE